MSSFRAEVQVSLRFDRKRSCHSWWPRTSVESDSRQAARQSPGRQIPNGPGQQWTVRASFFTSPNPSLILLLALDTADVPGCTFRVSCSNLPSVLIFCGPQQLRGPPYGSAKLNFRNCAFYCAPIFKRRKTPEDVYDALIKFGRS